MAKVTDQDIPADILDKYTKLLLPAKADGHVGGTVERRPPFTQPTWKGFIVDLPTIAQVWVRWCFKRSTICFGCQPQTGGVEPPDIGPRSREWWYNACGEYDVDYYRYFIHMTILKFLAETTPDWCETPHAISPIEVFDGEGKFGQSDWHDESWSWEQVWDEAANRFKDDDWDASSTRIVQFRAYKVLAGGNKRANISGRKFKARFNLKNIGEYDPGNVLQAWVEIPSWPVDIYANMVICGPGSGKWKAGVVEGYEVKGLFGNDDVVIEIFNSTYEPGTIIPPDPAEGQYKYKGGAQVSNTKPRIKFLVKEA